MSLRRAGGPRGAAPLAIALLAACLIAVASAMRPSPLSLTARQLLQVITNPQQCTGGYANNLNRQCLWQDSKDGSTSGGGGATCAAKELTIVNAKLDTVKLVGPGGGLVDAPLVPCCGDPSKLCFRCTPGQTVQGNLVLDIDVNSDTRYNIGLWVLQGTQLLSQCVGSRFPEDQAAYCGQTCSKNTIKPVNNPPVLDGEDNNDIDRCCGDLLRGLNTGISVPGFTFTCPALGSITPGQQPACPAFSPPFAWCLGWGAAANDIDCVLPTGPGLGNYEIFAPGSSAAGGETSKCNCAGGVLGGLERFIPTCDDVDPAGGAPVPFNCATAPGGGSGWSPKPGLPARFGPASLDACCVFQPTCGRTSSTQGENSSPFACTGGLAAKPGSSALTPRNEATCCSPTCVRPSLAQQCVPATPACSVIPCSSFGRFEPAPGASTTAPLDPATTANFLDKCCVALAPPTPSLALTASGDVDTCLVAQPSTSFAFTIANTGTGPANNVQFALALSPSSPTSPGLWQSTSCVRNSIPPSGPGTALPAFCAAPAAGAGGSQTIACGASVPPSDGTVLGASQSITCTFTVAATGDFLASGAVTGAVDAETGGALNPNDIAPASLDFDKVLFSCPPTRVPDTATCSCRKLVCDPCSEDNPSVFLATSAKDTSLRNAIWELPNFTPGQLEATPLFRCIVTGHSTVSGRRAFNGDIAFLWDGSLLVIDTNGQIGYVPQAQFDNFPPTATPDASRVCSMTILVPAPAAVPGDGFTGMASGFDSEDYWFSTAQNRVQNLVLSEQQGALTPVEGPQVNYSVPANPQAAATSGGGGTDLTPGPDGNIYRWVSAGAEMLFSGTRLIYDANAETLNGDWGYVSSGISAFDDPSVTYARSAFQNAGSFCTKTGVWGTAMWNDATANNTVARFFQFGVVNGAPSPMPLGLNLGFFNASAPAGATLPPAQEGGGVRAPNGNKMFLVGAATKPKCV